MNDMDENDIRYTVNYDMLLKSKDVSSIAKLLATKLKENPYTTVGDFLQSLSDSDVDSLLTKIDGDETEKNYSDVILISEMLATAEGLDSSKDFDAIMERTNYMVGFLTIESLRRKGLAKIHYENMSFGSDFGDKIIVEKI